MRQARRPLVKNIPQIPLFLAFAALFAASLWNAAQIGAAYPAVSLRFHTPVSPVQAQAARRHAMQAGGEDTPWPTFWAEDAAVAQSA